MRSRWIFTKKFDDRYKTRLVIRNFEQRYEIHYTKIYALIVNLKTIRILLALIAYFDLELHQIDVRIVFLNALLSEKECVYIKISEDWNIKSDEIITLLLLKSLYELKQTSKLWFEELHKTLTSTNFSISLKQFYVDECLYIGRELIIAVYVDDIIYLSLSIEMIKKVKIFLFARYEVRDLREAKEFLSLRIIRNRLNRRLRINQKNYCESVAKQWEMEKFKSRISMTLDCKLEKTILENIDQLLNNIETDIQIYKEMLESLMYSTQESRSDLSFVIERLT
jgi:hypothetical protein